MPNNRLDLIKPLENEGFLHLRALTPPNLIMSYYQEQLPDRYEVWRGEVSNWLECLEAFEKIEHLEV
jgi:hypothetical protein